jgi:hypothetical protein
VKYEDIKAKLQKKVKYEDIKAMSGGLLRALPKGI